MTVKSFKKFIKGSVVLTLHTHHFSRKKKALTEKFHDETKNSSLNSYDKGLGKKWADKYNETSQGLDKRLSDHYVFDDDDKDQLDIFVNFGKDINLHLINKAKPKPEKSKPEKKDPAKEADAKVVADNTERHVKSFDGMLGQHTSPSADFYIYAGLKKSPLDVHQETTGQPHDGSDIEGIFNHFASTSIDPKVARDVSAKGQTFQAGDKTANILKIKVPAKSKHGAYVGGQDGFGDEKEFILKKDRKMKISPEPEEKTYDDKGKKRKLLIWHAELQG